MRRLLLLRHAKAAPGDGRDDFERELTDSGREDACDMGRFIVRRGLAPNLIVYSGARRTRQTAELVAAKFPHPVEAVANNELYDATRVLVLEVLRALPDAALCVLVVGHNPGTAEVANLLAGGGARESRLRMAAKYPTTALAVLESEIAHWAEIAPKIARLQHFVTPADLEARER
ncbi:MAG: SixA phosphatase family protein [Roseiarcus sp.]